MPSLTITSSASTLRFGYAAVITFTFSEDPGLSFTHEDITVSGGTLGPLSGDGLIRVAVFTPTSGVNAGSASITVAEGAYTNAGGDLGAAAASPSLTYDTLVPNPPSVPILTRASDSGASSTDNITNVSTPTFTGTAEANATVILYEGATEIGRGTANVSGVWEITSSALTEGPHTITARAADAAGNLSAASSGLMVAIDQVAPAVAITSSAALVGSAGATITFTFSEDPGASFTASNVTVTGGTLGPLSGDGLIRTATFTPAANVASGSAAISAFGYTDAAGNVGTGGSIPSLLIDTVAPSASAHSVYFSSDTGTSNTDLLTHTATQTISGVLTAPLAAGDVVQVSLNNGATWTNVSSAVGATSWTLSSQTLTDSNTLQVRVADAAGNTSPPLSAAYVLDQTAPTVAMTCNVAVMNTAGATITFTFSEDPGESFTDDDVSVFNGALGPLSGSGLTRTATFTPAPNVASGAASLTVAAGTYIDAAGNLGAGGVLSLPLDTLAPAPPSAPDLTAASDNGASATDNITSVVRPTFTGTAEAHATVILYDTDGTTVLGTGSADAAGAWSITSSTLSLGDHALTAKATDAAGNLSDAGPSLTVTIESPTPVTPPPRGVVTVVTPDGARVTGDAQDNRITSSGGADTVWAGEGRDTVLGGAADDVLQGNQGADSIVAGGGADLVHGGQGDDFLQGSTGRDLLFGDMGADTLHGGQDADTIQGGQGDDFVFGDLGDDVLRGGQGNDDLAGGLGDDYLSGDLGTNTLTGGGGADTFHSSGLGHDLVTDFNRGEGDRILLAPGLRYTVSEVGGDVRIDFADGGDLVLRGVQLADLTGAWIAG